MTRSWAVVPRRRGDAADAPRIACAAAGARGVCRRLDPAIFPRRSDNGRTGGREVARPERTFHAASASATAPNQRSRQFLICRDRRLSIQVIEVAAPSPAGRWPKPRAARPVGVDLARSALPRFAPASPWTDGFAAPEAAAGPRGDPPSSPAEARPLPAVSEARPASLDRVAPPRPVRSAGRRANNRAGPRPLPSLGRST